MYFNDDDFILRIRYVPTYLGIPNRVIGLFNVLCLLEPLQQDT
jgi:hypothetical protein